MSHAACSERPLSLPGSRNPEGGDTLLSHPRQGWPRPEPERGRRGRLCPSPSTDLRPPGLDSRRASLALHIGCLWDLGFGSPMTGPKDGFPPPWKVQASWNHPNPVQGQQRGQESSTGPGLGARRAETSPRLGVLGGAGTHHTGLSPLLRVVVPSLVREPVV